VVTYTENDSLPPLLKGERGTGRTRYDFNLFSSFPSPTVEEDSSFPVCGRLSSPPDVKCLFPPPVRKRYFFSLEKGVKSPLSGSD